MTHIPLDRAYLCADETCRAVGSNSRYCEACGNPVLLSLAGVLDRPATEPEPLMLADACQGV